MKRTEIIAWVLVGILIGLLIGMWLTRNKPEQPPDKADAKPVPNISKLDTDTWEAVG